ncbi:MAG: helix-turn-helix domain-containing protein [Oscillospiraceae bacterium]
MIAEKVKKLREQKGLSQAELARQLGITRSSVNAWEMGISVPSTQYIVDLAGVFEISTDYLLGVDSSSTISVAGLTDSDILLVHSIIEHLKNK